MILVTFLQYDCGPKHGSIFIIHVVDNKEYCYTDIHITTLLSFHMDYYSKLNFSSLSLQHGSSNLLHSSSC